MKKYWPHIPILLCFLIAIAFSLKNLREPDLWWQIRTGEWILQNHQVPKQDVFSYTYGGTDWINIKWGFEVLAALVTKLAGPESIFLIQVIVSCCLLFFLIKAAKQFLPKALLPGSDLILVIAILFTIVAIEYRIIGRPEMFSHLFTAVFLYLLLRYRKEPSRKILWLVPLQIVWANFHEAFAIGIILITIFCVGAWVEYLLAKRKIPAHEERQPKELSVALIGALTALAVNPYGTKLLARPFSILGQVYENKFTTELAGFQMHDYWQWNTYLSLGIVIIGLIGCIFYFRGLKTKRKRWKLFAEQLGIGYIITFFAFAYLAATAYRNIAFLVIVFFPAFVFGLNALYVPAKWLQKFAGQMMIAIVVIEAGLYGFIVSNKYYELSGSHDRYGLEMLSTFNPVGAADFISRNKLSGKCFSDYLTSSYLLWKEQPEFKTFIDLRDLDVFPSEFFNTFAEAVTYPDEFERQDSTYHFSYVVLYRPQFSALHNYLFNQSRFKLAFLDPVAAVYVPRQAGDSSVMQFTKPKLVKASFFSFGISKLFNPFYSGFAYTKVDYDFLAASYCVTVGKLDEAEKFASQASRNNIENYKGLKMLGDVYYHRLRNTADPVERGRELNTSLNYFQQAINQKSDYADAYLGEGAVFFEQRNMTKALECFEQCIALDGANLDAYLSAGSCCNYFVNASGPDADEYAHKAIGFYKKADYLNPDNPSIMLNLGFLYARLNDCGNAAKYLLKIVDFPGLSENERQQVRQCLGRCGH